MRLVRFSVGKDSEWLSGVTNKLVSPETKCGSGGEESHAEEELNSVEEGMR